MCFSFPQLSFSFEIRFVEITWGGGGYGEGSRGSSCKVSVTVARFQPKLKLMHAFK
jgi:hypothetical protein